MTGNNFSGAGVESTFKILANVGFLVALFAPPSQADFNLKVADSTPLPGSEGLVSYTIDLTWDGFLNNSIRGFSNPTISIASGLGVHQVFQKGPFSVDPTQTPTPDDYGQVFDAKWAAYDTHFLVRGGDLDALACGQNCITLPGNLIETLAGTGESLPYDRSDGFFAPVTGYGTVSSDGGSWYLLNNPYTLGYDRPLVQIVERAQDSIYLSLGVIDGYGQTTRIENFLVGPVPEPSTAFLAALQLGVCGFVRRIRRCQT